MIPYKLDLHISYGIAGHTLEPGGPVTYQVLENVEIQQSTTTLDHTLEPMLIEIRSTAVDHDDSGNRSNSTVQEHEVPVLLPTVLNVTNCVISDNDEHFLVTPCVGGVVNIAELNSGETLPPDKPSLSQSCGDISPDIDPDKIIMDLGKTTEWVDLTEAGEFVVSPQLDILELQWNELMNKNVPATKSSDPSQPDVTASNAYNCAFASSSSSESNIVNTNEENIRSPKEITSSTTNTLVSDDIVELWGNVENNNYILEDAVSSLGNSLVLDDRFALNRQTEEIIATQTNQTDKNRSNSPLSIVKTGSTNGSEDKNLEESSCKCKSGEKKESDCCVTVCLKTLNQLRKVLENGCCKSSSLANNSLAAIALQMASSANCCSGSCV